MRVSFIFSFIWLVTLPSFCQIQIGQDIDGESANDQSGKSVSLSSDGSILAIGAHKNSGNGMESGHVRVYQNQSGNWVQIGQDIDGEDEFDQFGISVSLSADGSTLAVGGSTNNSPNGIDSGHVRVYGNSGGSWIQIGSDLDGESAFDISGISVSLSSDGSIVAIGADNNDGNGDSSGHVRVFENIAGVWTQIGSDIDGELSGDRFGRSVSLSSDGSKLAVGAHRNSGSGFESGHVKVYENVAGSWIQVGQDIDGEAAEDLSGYSLSLSSDGSIVAVGAYRNDGNGMNSGHVRVYENVFGNWIQIGQDIDGEAAGDASGFSVDISSDGSVLAVGAPGNSQNGNLSGNVRVYQNTGGLWTQVGTDIDGEAIEDQSGHSLSLSLDSSKIAIGANRNDGNGIDSGHVRVFDIGNILSISELNLSNFINLYPNPVKNTLSFRSLKRIHSIEIYGLLGEHLLTTTLFSFTGKVDMTSFKSGIYLIKIKVGGQIIFYKVVKS